MNEIKFFTRPQTIVRTGMFCSFLMYGLFMAGEKGYAQPVHKQDSVKIVRNVIGFVPSKADVINGWAVGWLAGPDYVDRSPVTFNGLHTEVGPAQGFIAVFVAGFLAAHALWPGTYVELLRKHEPDSLSGLTIDSAKAEALEFEVEAYKHHIRGLSFGLFGLEDKFFIQGVHLSVTIQSATKLNGLAIAALGSGYDETNGVLIAGFVNGTIRSKGLHVAAVNLAKEMKGVQIGLFNNSKKMKGVQFGLWNRIGKRGFPIINFRFR